MSAALQPGPELDALIAEKVMGLPKAAPQHADGSGKWLVRYFEETYPGSGQVKERTGKCHELPRHSTDIAAAWQAVERLKHPVGGSTPESSMAVARFAHWWDHAGLWLMSPAEAAHAICVNLLAAVGYKPD